MKLRTSNMIKFLTCTLLIAVLLAAVNSIATADGNKILRGEPVHTRSSDSNHNILLTHQEPHEHPNDSHSHSHSHDQDHPYHDYSYLDELKKTLDPDNEMSHMEFVESLRANDPSYNETEKKQMIKAPWK